MPTRREFIQGTAVAAMATAAPSSPRAPSENPYKGTGSVKTYRIPNTDLIVSRIAYGCGSLASFDKNPVTRAGIANAATLIHTAHSQGITLFDHADLYGFGKAEVLFGEVLKQSPGLRERIVIQSKCGQVFPEGWRPGSPVRVDLSGAHIVSAVEGSLKRLGTDRLDILLLHAPSTLVRPEEVAQAFDALQKSGKARYFGVSNHSADQIRLLRKAVRQSLVVNQVHLGLGYSDLLSDGLELTLELAQGGASHARYSRSAYGGTFDYCRLADIQVQAASPLREVLNSKADTLPQVKATLQRLTDLAQAKQTTVAALALAWLLHHPAGILPLTGVTQPEQIIENCSADRISMTDEEWYDLLAVAADLKSRALSS